MKIWQVQVGDDTFRTGEKLPQSFQPEGAGLYVKAIFLRGGVVEDATEIEEIQFDDEEDEVGRVKRFEYSLREGLVPDKVQVFAVAKAEKKGERGSEPAGAWHPSTGFRDGLGQGMYIELSYRTEEETRVPYVARVDTHNAIIAAVRTVEGLEKQAFAAATESAAASAKGEEGVGEPNGAGKQPAEGNA
jgi:hypothetical protein